MVCIIVLYSGLLTAVSCSSSDLEFRSNAQVVNKPVVQNSLEQTARKLTEFYDDKNCKEFIKTFPTTFQLFDQIYGFDDETGALILYSKYEEQISYFSSCSEVSDLEKLNKVLGIGINGKWDAVATSLLQDLAFKLIKDHPNEAKKVLDDLTDDKASSFWFFLFDGPHPRDKENVKKVDLLRNLLGKKSRQSKLLSEQYTKLLTLKDH